MDGKNRKKYIAYYSEYNKEIAFLIPSFSRLISWVTVETK